MTIYDPKPIHKDSKITNFKEIAMQNQSVEDEVVLFIKEHF
jgi:hypothetical protein